jgi:hypothetical protein
MSLEIKISFGQVSGEEAYFHPEELYAFCRSPSRKKGGINVLDTPKQFIRTIGA